MTEQEAIRAINMLEKKREKVQEWIGRAVREGDFSEEIRQRADLVQIELKIASYKIHLKG